MLFWSMCHFMYLDVRLRLLFVSQKLIYVKHFLHRVT